MARAVVLRELGELVAARGGGEPVRVGVDGRGASGKTTLADELAREVASRGREVIRGSVDGFLRPRAERYARGRDSAEGCYHDARDWDALRRLLLEPMGRAGDRLYRTRSFDEAADRPLHEPARRAAAGGGRCGGDCGWDVPAAAGAGGVLGACDFRGCAG